MLVSYTRISTLSSITSEPQPRMTCSQPKKSGPDRHSHPLTRPGPAIRSPDPDRKGLVRPRHALDRILFDVLEKGPVSLPCFVCLTDRKSYGVDGGCIRRQGWRISGCGCVRRSDEALDVEYSTVGCVLRGLGGKSAKLLLRRVGARCSDVTLQVEGMSSVYSRI